MKNPRKKRLLIIVGIIAIIALFSLIFLRKHESQNDAPGITNVPWYPPKTGTPSDYLMVKVGMAHIVGDERITLRTLFWSIKTDFGYNFDRSEEYYDSTNHVYYVKLYVRSTLSIHSTLKGTIDIPLYLKNPPVAENIRVQLYADNTLTDETIIHNDESDESDDDVKAAISDSTKVDTLHIDTKK